MAISFPSGLPYGLRQDYGMQTVSPLQRTEMDSGRSRSRRKFSSVPVTVTISWIFNDSQSVKFESWFKDEAMDGAAWFLCPLRLPYGLGVYECRFEDVYTGPTLVGRSWRYSAQLEMKERQVLPWEWIEAGGEFLESPSILDIALNREWPLA